ncbi:MAG: hypothetical protein LBC68_05785, partial [Prevotellaceae bacterium]|nr:hypothetical protein [Prevotellaceae bacterium]
MHKNFFNQSVYHFFTKLWCGLSFFIVIFGAYLYGEELQIVKKFKNDPYYPPEIIVNRLPDKLPEIQITGQPLDTTHEYGKGTAEVSVSILTEQVSPRNNYIFVPHVGSPISFATGKPLSISNMQLEKYGIERHNGIDIYCQNYSHNENLCALFIDRGLDSYLAIVDLKTGSFTKFFLPRIELELSSVQLMGFSNFVDFYSSSKTNLVDYFVVKLVEKELGSRIGHVPLWCANVSSAESGNFRPLLVPTAGWFVKLLPDMRFITGDLTARLQLKDPKRCVLWSGRGGYINEIPVRVSEQCHVSNDGKFAAFLETESSVLSDIPIGTPPEKTWIRIFDVSTTSTKIPRKEICTIWLGWFRWAGKDINFAISDDNRLIAVNESGFVRIYEIKTGKVITNLHTEKHSVPQFSHNGKYLWISEKHTNKYIVVYDVNTGKKIFFIAYFDKNGYWAVVAADGRYDGTKEAINNIKIKPEGLPDKPENYFWAKDKPELYVDGLLATFFNAPMPDHYWFRTP